MTDQRSARILVIDDEVTQRILVKEYLEEAGYVVRLSDDGRRGLKMAAATKPDLIILDLMLPSMDGYTLCTCLKQAEATAGIPIILITASREAGVIDRGLAAGADDFVTKPVDWAFLADRVKMVLARAQQQKSQSGSPAFVAAPAAAPAVPAPVEVLDKAVDPAVVKEIEEKAEAEIARVKADSREELRLAAQRHAQAFEAAKIEIRAEARKSAEAAQAETIESLKAAAAADIAAMEKAHRSAIAALRAEAGREIEAVKMAAKAELSRLEQAQASRLVAARAEAEAQTRMQFSSRETDGHAAVEAVRAEMAAAQVAANRDLAAMRESYEARLSAAAEWQQVAHRLEAELTAAGEAHQSEILALSEAASRERDALRDTYELRLKSVAEEQTKQLAAELQAARDKLQEHAHCEDKADELEAEYADRVRSAWDFARAASVSHIDIASEINTLCRQALHSLSSSADAIGPQDALLAIDQQARNLSASLGKLRMLAQIMSGGADFRDTIFDLAKLVTDATASVRDIADAQKVSLGIDLPQQPMVIRADHARLSYAVVSLLANALRFTPAGGVVSVTLKPDDHGAARLVIEDSGVGIAPVMLDSLRTCLDRPGDLVTGAGDGVGLGVPVATALVRQHGGHIEIESGLGRGTEVAIVLPMGKRGQTAASSRHGAKRRAAG